MPARRLLPKEVRHETLGLKAGWIWRGPTSIGERKECQRGRWPRKRVNCDVSHWLRRRTKHPFKIWKFFPSRRVLKLWGKARKGNLKETLYKVWRPSPTGHVLKLWGKVLKGNLKNSSKSSFRHTVVIFWDEKKIWKLMSSRRNDVYRVGWYNESFVFLFFTPISFFIPVIFLKKYLMDNFY